MRILLLSSYHGGSHLAWANGYQRHSAHEVELLTLPARFWKWRMHGGAVTLARRFLEGIKTGRLATPDLLMFTDMVDVSTFLALTRRICATIPAVLYMHENQLTYPLPESTDTGPMRRQRGERDLHYAFVNFASMLAADHVYFNSAHHRRELLKALPTYLRHFPEFNELGAVPGLKLKSGILPLGINTDYLSQYSPKQPQLAPPLILWNQRWEFDKNPKDFFDAISTLACEEIPFQLAICGQSFSRYPAELEAARSALQNRIIHWGFADRKDYRRLLWRSAITASTALHEFFGISILEAMYCRTFAVLPRRLSYPELLPVELHGPCLYDNFEGLVDRLKWALLNTDQAQAIGRALSRAAAEYDWHVIAPRYDAEFEGLV